jgi:hypothetical protein
MRNPLIRFSLTVILILSLAFSVHVFVLNTKELPLFGNQIMLSYIINTGLAIGIFALLFFLKEKYKSQLGFLFMAGSALKFAVFFIVFQPIYKQDGDVSTLEFLAFFVPYVLCLIFETFSLSKLLNRLDSHSS